MIHKIPEPKWDRPPVNNKKVNMENKLLELKEFCKWYCPNKGSVINPTENCDKEIKCDDCGEITISQFSVGLITLPLFGQ